MAERNASNSPVETAPTGTHAADEADASALLETARKHLVANYRPPDFVLNKGRGCEVWDTQGRRYLDLTAGVAVSTLGHCHPRYVEAIAEQASRLIHTSNYFYNEPNVRLAEALTQRAGYARAFFCNSGAEANEALVKAARRSFYAKGETDRHRVLTFRRAFHGRTFGTIALGGNPKYTEGFGPPLAGVEQVDFGDLAAVKATLDESFCGVLVEPVQGEGGVFPAPDGFLRGLREITEERGALLLADEVQTGIGRTGAFLALDHAGVKADGVALAKGLGGGFPIGALLVGPRLEDALPPGSHGSTYGGNPLGSAAALAVLRILEDEGLVERARDTGKWLGEELTQLASRHAKVCGTPRGQGLLWGLPLADGIDARGALGAVRAKGVLLTIAGTALRFCPPLIVTQEQLAEALSAIDQAMSELSK